MPNRIIHFAPLMSSHLNNLFERYSALETCRSDIQQAFELLTVTFQKDRKLLLCGNGGSAADSEHWAGEMLKGFAHPRPLSASMRQGLSSELAACLQWAFPVIPLTGFPAFATAFSNDVEPECVFAQLVLALGRTGGGIVMAEMTGPGCIWRIWAGTPETGHVQIFLDGSTNPAVDLPFQDYFNGTQEPFTYQPWFTRRAKV